MMKKIYSLAFCLAMGVETLFAQKNTDLQFVTIDEDGNETGVVEDGATIDASTLVEDAFQGNFISTGLGVKNTTDSGKRVQIDYELISLDNGEITCCFSTCANYSKNGTYYSPLLSKSGNRVNLPVVKKNSVSDLAGEWFYAAKGKATVKFTIKVGTANSSKTDSEGIVYDVVEGPSVTVNFLNGVVSGINHAKTDDVVSTSYVDLAGRKVANPTQGIYVKQTLLKNGQVKNSKVIIK